MIDSTIIPITPSPHTILGMKTVKFSGVAFLSILHLSFCRYEKNNEIAAGIKIADKMIPMFIFYILSFYDSHQQRDFMKASVSRFRYDCHALGDKGTTEPSPCPITIMMLHLQYSFVKDGGKRAVPLSLKSFQFGQGINTVCFFVYLVIARL